MFRNRIIVWEKPTENVTSVSLIFYDEGLIAATDFKIQYLKQQVKRPKLSTISSNATPEVSPATPIEDNESVFQSETGTIKSTRFVEFSFLIKMIYQKNCCQWCKRPSWSVL